MATLPGDASPPKSGWRCRALPLLMKAMKLAEDGSTGAAEISVFHQLSDGNSGSGAGGGAPSTGTVGGHWARVAAATRPQLIASRMRTALLRMAAGLPGCARWCRRRRYGRAVARMNYAVGILTSGLPGR